MQKLETLVSEETISDIKTFWDQNTAAAAAARLDALLRQSDGTAIRGLDYDILFARREPAEVNIFKRSMRAYSNSVIGAYGSPSVPLLSEY